jgi:4-aminobutyrate aminotransferase-like enzyme
MGKPIGDGHPLAAVVTTPAIAAEFARKFEYFNTFGGNPVSAAVGMAVLDVIEQENILQNVHDVGGYLGQGMKDLALRCDTIGDVRGKGLFYGVELVSDRDSQEPATDLAKRVVEDLRENGVLLSRTGAFNNVLKIRPPLIFAKANADVLLEKLEHALVDGKKMNC